MSGVRVPHRPPSPCFRTSNTIQYITQIPSKYWVFRVSTSEGVLWKPRVCGGISGESFKHDGGISGIEKLGGVMALTDTEIRKSRPCEKAYRLPDGKGLFLFVTPTGGRLWGYKYRHDGKQKLMALGQDPDDPLALARERHATARRLLATGVDPMEQRKAEKITLRSTAQDSFHAIAV